MDRVIAYPGQVPAVEDFLQAQKNALLAIGRLIESVMGQSPVAAGLAATLDGSANLTLGPGSLTIAGSVDGSAYGILPADATPVVKQGLLNTSTTMALGSYGPGTAGQAVNVLVEASVADLDASPTVLNYYNSQSPTTPYAGQMGGGTAQPTRRNGAIVFTALAGGPAAAGTQSTPAVGTGRVPLYVVTLGYGAAPTVAPHPEAPFCPFTLPQLTPGFSRFVTFFNSATWVAPSAVTRVRVRLWGGGGGSGGTYGAPSASQGGGGGGYCEGIVAVVPGSSYAVTVAAGGSPGIGGPSPSGGGDGGTSSFIGLAATGGKGGLAGNGGLPSGTATGGVGSGGNILNTIGGSANTPFQLQAGIYTATGGASFGTPAQNGGAQGAAAQGEFGLFPGGGAAGSGNQANGAAGGNGYVILEY